MRNNNKKTNKIIWQPIFSREGFPYFIASLAFEGYIFDMKKKIGWGYRDQLMVSKKNFLTVYGSVRDQKSFVKFTTNKDKNYFVSVNDIILDCLNRAVKASELIGRELNNKKLKPDKLVGILGIFYKHYRDLYSVYRFPTLFDSFYYGLCRDELIREFAKTKDRCGRFFSKTDKIILGKIKDCFSKLLGIDTQSFLSLNYQEIVDSIHNKKLVVGRSELRKRYNSYILLATDNNIQLIIKDQKEWLDNNLILSKDNLSADEIKGQVAYQGKVKGKVKLVFLTSDLKVNKKDLILVTPMTTINHTPYLKNFSAIVTDEGGLTCHAAIVARELGIPCIIGTKFATKIFKDGDLVEVDANKGIVRKIVL